MLSRQCSAINNEEIMMAMIHRCTPILNSDYYEVWLNPSMPALCAHIMTALHNYLLAHTLTKLYYNNAYPILRSARKNTMFTNGPPLDARNHYRKRINQMAFLLIVSFYNSLQNLCLSLIFFKSETELSYQDNLHALFCIYLYYQIKRS